MTQPHEDARAGSASNKSAGDAMARWMDWLIEDEGIGLEVRTSEPGGAVNMGITFETFVLWSNLQHTPRPTFADLGELTRDEAEQIYRQLYYEPARCDVLPAGVDYAHFDAAVNKG